MSHTDKKNSFTWLLSPKTIALSLILGGLYGHFLKSYVQYTEPFGKIFLALLEMCILPLIITAVTSSVARLLKSYKTHRNKQILLLPFYFLFGMLLIALISTTLSRLIHIGGDIDAHARVLLGKAIINASQHFAINHTSAAHHSQGFLDYLITDNIVNAAAFGKSLPLLLFSILLGLSLGAITSRSGDATLLFFDGLFEAFIKLINGIIYLLPIGLFCLISQQTAYTGLDAFSPLASLLIFFITAGLVLTLVCLAITAIKTKRSLWRVILQLREALTIGFVSSSSFSALPFALNSLENNFKLDKDDVNIILPLSMSLNFIGSTVFFSTLTIFMMHFYGHQITPIAYITILFGSIFTSIAIGSVPAIAGFSLISIVFYPLGLPVKSTVVILILCSQITDPLITLVNISGNIMLTALISRKSTQ